MFYNIFINKNMISDKRLREIINEEITKTEVEAIVSRKLSSSYDSREFKKTVKEITADVIEDLFKTLWNRSNSWKGGLTR